MITRLNHWLYKSYEAIALSGFSLLAIIVGWQVLARYVLNDSPSWSEPLAMLLLLYAVLLGSACGVSKGFHLNLVFFVQQMPHATQVLCQRVVSVMVALLGLAMINYGSQMAAQTAAYIIPGLPLSMALQYLPLVISGIGFVLFSIEQLLSLTTTSTTAEAN